MAQIRNTTPSLLEDIFEVLQRDPDGKKFDKVSRYVFRSDLYEMDLTLDINIDVYALQPGDKVSLCLAWTLNLDNTPDSGKYDASYQTLSKRSLMDKYEYVMYGKVFKYKDNQSSGQVKVEVYASFGGLLMLLIGDPKKLEVFEVDMNVYLLIRKV